MSESSSKKNSTTVGDGAANAPAPPILAELVFTALDGWSDWIFSVDRGLIRPIQFLAVVLWVIRTDGIPEDQERQIVEGWAEALKRACEQRVVIPVSPVTCLPLPLKQTSTTDWAFTLGGAQAFLDSMPVGFHLKPVLDHFRALAEAKDGLPIEKKSVKSKKSKASLFPSGEEVYFYRKRLESEGHHDFAVKAAAHFGIGTKKAYTLAKDYEKSLGRGPSKEAIGGAFVFPRLGKPAEGN